MRDRWRRAIALSAAELCGLIEFVALQGRRGPRGQRDDRRA
jgi:hypothetical protein